MELSLKECTFALGMTAQLLCTWFEIFNARYFDCELPKPHFVVNHARRMLGQFSCRKIRKGLFRRYQMVDYTIKVSDFYKMEEHDYQSTLLHEMIHYYIAYKGLRDSSAHGILFRQWMTRLNHDGWHITISSHTEHLAVSQHKDNEPYLLLLVRLSDGRCFLSVVNPAYQKRIDRQAAASPIIANHYWTTSKDMRYATWTKTRSLRRRRISLQEYQRLLNLFSLKQG